MVAAPDSGLAALRGVATACSVTDLDARDAELAAVLVTPHGTSVKVSRSAAALIRLASSDLEPRQIAARFETDPETLDAAARALAVRLRSQLDALANRKPEGFVAARPIVSAETVSRWSTPLAPLFAPWFVALAGAMAIAVIFNARWHDPRTPLPPHALWAGFALGLVLMFVHELGHAAACRYHGARVGPIGLAIYLIYPAFYCDVTHTWSLPRRSRLVVDLGGTFFQLLATAVVAAGWRATDSPVLLQTVRISLATMALNLLPLGRLDGYWALGDALGVTNLRAQQRRVIAALWARARGRDAPLPWRWSTTLVIAGYALATAYFVTAMVVWLVPHVIAEAWHLPSRWLDLVHARDGEAVYAALGRIVSSILIAVIAIMLARSLLARVRAALAPRAPARPS